MAYSHNGFIRDQQQTRENQDQSETSVRLERDKLETRPQRDGAAVEGLTQSNKIAGENQRQQERGREIARDSQRQLEKARDSQRELERRYGAIPELFRHIVHKLTDKRTDRAIP